MQKHNPRILMVDDEIYHSRVYREALEDDGFEVLFTDSVDDALEIARSNTFDAVLVDVMISPGRAFDVIETAGGYSTGRALARELRKILPESKIIALTISADAEIQSWFTRDDSVAYLQKKEVLASELPRIIRRILRHDAKPPRAFIVHGRDRASLLELKNLLQNRFGFAEPIILAERPSRGMTIIEKFEFYASAADIVFVLLTPDDLGALSGSASLQGRARQNTLFEYGFFLGALGRRSGKVILLVKAGLEIPSDIYGIVQIDITHGVEAAAEQIRSELSEFLGL